MGDDRLISCWCTFSSSFLGKAIRKKRQQQSGTYRIYLVVYHCCSAASAIQMIIPIMMIFLCRCSENIEYFAPCDHRNEQNYRQLISSSAYVSPCHQQPVIPIHLILYTVIKLLFITSFFVLLSLISIYYVMRRIGGSRSQLEFDSHNRFTHLYTEFANRWLIVSSITISTESLSHSNTPNQHLNTSRRLTLISIAIQPSVVIFFMLNGWSTE